MERARLTVRLPPELAEWADTVAAQMGLSLNTAMVSAVQSWADYHGKRMGLAVPALPVRPVKKRSPMSVA